MKTFYLIVAVVVVTFCAVDAGAQGCSDAGFCSIGNLAAHNGDTAKQYKSQLSLSLPLGIGDEDVFVFTPGIEYNRTLSLRWSVQAKLTANYASGNLAGVGGPGDVYLSGTYLFKPFAKWKTSVSLGTKLPLNQSNLKEGGRSLPMQYQSSLGTIDLITGLAVNSARWQFAAGWQQPLSGINRNNFLPAYWNKPDAYKYPPSNDFKRKGDVLLRSAYNFRLNNKLQATAGVLGIYHLGKDTYIDANLRNTPIEIEGSEGLTLNATAALQYELTAKLGIGISGGLPLVIRDIRPDGLTRSFVFSPQLTLKF